MEPINPHGFIVPFAPLSRLSSTINKDNRILFIAFGPQSSTSVQHNNTPFGAKHKKHTSWRLPEIGYPAALNEIYTYAVKLDKHALISLCLCSVDYSTRGVRLSWIFLGTLWTFNGAPGNTWSSIDYRYVVHFTDGFFCAWIDRLYWIWNMQFYSICIYCILNQTCLLYFSFVVWEAIQFFFFFFF